MKELFEALLGRLTKGLPMVMVSVIESSGSAPRGPGARMLVDENGRAFGTVGGSAIEYQAILEAAALLETDGCFIREFSLHSQATADLDMVCGGDMKILLQHIGPAYTGLCHAAMDKIASGEAAYLVTELASGKMRLASEFVEDSGFFTQQVSGMGTVYVFGGGHVAQALVPLLARAEFSVVVLDDRPEFANAALFPDAMAAQLVDFERLEGMEINAHDYVVIMTRGHSYDQVVLGQMLKTPAQYIGMMGSRGKRAHIYANLLGQGHSQADIDRVHSPIGLPIQAETPFEIGVSIVAELIQFRAKDADA